MTMLKDMLAAEQLKAYGTSEGASKAWDTRGRGRKGKNGGAGSGQSKYGAKKMEKMHEVLKGHGYRMTDDSKNALGERITAWKRDLPRGDAYSASVHAKGWQHSHESPSGQHSPLGIGIDHNDLKRHLASY